MILRRLLLIVTVSAVLTGCIGRGTVLIKERVTTTVIDEDTRAPLSDVEVYLIATDWWPGSWNQNRKVAETGEYGVVDVRVEYVAEMQSRLGSHPRIGKGACALEFRKEGYEAKRISSPFKNPPDPLALTRIPMVD